MKRVTWIELFLDLVFVFAVTSVSELLHDDHSWAGTLQALVVFVPIYWVWVGVTMFANIHDADGGRSRFVIFAVAFCGLVLGLSLHGAFGDAALIFGCTYWVARLVLLVAVRGRPNRGAFITFTIGAFVTGPAFVVGALLPPDQRTVMWAIAAVVDLSVPFFARRRLATAPFDAGHLAERFGLFIIIALGETVLETGRAAGEREWDALTIAGLAAAFAVCGGLWWVYFVYAAPAIHSAIEGASVAIEIIRPVLSYGHLVFIAGIVSVAVGLGEAVRLPLSPLHLDVASLLLGGAALYLVAFAFTRWRMFHTLAAPRLIAAATCLGLIPVTTIVPAVVGLTVLAGALLALNMVERRVVPSTLHKLK